MVKNWNRRAPDNYWFTPKFPKVITHDKRFNKMEKELSIFYETMQPLKDKLLALLIQLTHSYHHNKGLEDLGGYDLFFNDD